MIKIFDGKQFANELEKELKRKVDKLKKKGTIPKLASILVGDNNGSKLYLMLKKKAAERIGAEVEIYNFSKKTSANEISELINKLNVDKSVHGIMIQLPLPEHFTNEERDGLIQLIKPEKDVDGLQDKSLYVTPVTKAVLASFKAALEVVPYLGDPNICVIGSKGFEGKKILSALKEMDYEASGVDKDTKVYKKCIANADVVISATGEEGLIEETMVKDGVVAIDVGSPKGDFDKSVYKKTSFTTPVPGGIGPMTIAFLMENLVESVPK